MLKISLEYGWWFKFYSDREEVYAYSVKRCPHCRAMFLDPVYCYIIDMLKEANLLDENFEEICCTCAVLRYFGLLDKVSELTEFQYDKEEDILFILFGEKITQIRIHDFSKIELF